MLNSQRKPESSGIERRLYRNSYTPIKSLIKWNGSIYTAHILCPVLIGVFKA